MRTETRKLAGIATMLCGSMVTFGAHAFEQGAPAVASAAPDAAGGSIEPLVLRDAAPSAATDAITQAVVDAFPAQTARAFSGDTDGIREAPVSYAAPIAVVLPRREAAEEAENVAQQVAASNEAIHATNEAVVNEAQYAVDASATPSVSSSPSSSESDVLAQRDAVEHQDAPDATAAVPVDAQEAQARVEPLPVSYAAPIAVPVRKAQQVETPREKNIEEHAQPRSMQHEQLTLDATPTPPPVSPARPEPLANERESVKPPVSYARPVAVPAARAATSVQNDARASTHAFAQTPAQTPEQPPEQQLKAPVSYAAPIAVPQAARNDTPPGRVREVNARVDTEDPNWSSKTIVAISEEKLDSMRGGFDVANGLKVSFGLSRVAYVNGSLVTQTSFNIPDLSNITTQQAQALAAANMGSILQNGGGNIAQQGSVQGLSGAVIQNTLNNQNIQALTTINATVNSLGFFKNMNLGDTLNNALLNSIRPR